MVPRISLQDTYKPPGDLDAWNISLFPQDLYQLFAASTPVQLVNHAPNPIIKDHDTFKDWVYLAQCTVMLKVPPQFKTPLLEAFKNKSLVIDPSPWPTAFIIGSQLISTKYLVDALEATGCKSVRAQAYGMKQPLSLPHIGFNLGNTNHHLASLNNFDLGKNYSDPLINLLKPKNPHLPGIQLYPMLLPIGEDYGSVNMSITHEGEVYRIKAYPRLIHHLKAQAERTRLGGIRLEVTVQARTLQEAIRKVSHTPFLNANEFLNPSFPLTKPYQLQVKGIGKEQYLTNARDMLAKADSKGIFTGHDHNPATKEAQRIVMDLFNSLGWNSGRRRPTSFKAADPWWEEVTALNVQLQDVSEPPAISLDHIQGVPATSKLFKAVRNQLPCHNCYYLGPMYNLDGGQGQFRVRCRRCRATLNQHKFRAYLARLLDDKKVTLDLEAFNIRPPPPPQLNRTLPGEAPLPDVLSEDEELEGMEEEEEMVPSDHDMLISEDEDQDFNLPPSDEDELAEDEVHLSSDEEEQPAPAIRRSTRASRARISLADLDMEDETDAGPQQALPPIKASTSAPVKPKTKAPPKRQARLGDQAALRPYVLIEVPHTPDNRPRVVLRMTESPEPTPQAESEDVTMEDPQAELDLQRQEEQELRQQQEAEKREAQAALDKHREEQALIQAEAARLKHKQSEARAAEMAAEQRKRDLATLKETKMKALRLKEAMEQEKLKRQLEQEKAKDLKRAKEVQLEKQRRVDRAKAKGGSPNVSFTLPEKYKAPGRPDLLPLGGGLALTSKETILKDFHFIKTNNSVLGDGNCQFRVMSQHLYGTQAMHALVRQKVVSHLRANPSLILHFAAAGDSHLSAEEYLQEMAKNKTWGDEITLAAMAEAYRCSIFVLSCITPASSTQRKYITSIYPDGAQGPHYGFYYVQNSRHYMPLYF
ncbi:uncharacterized protein PSFLO_07560 [Pseudozyma flocculosa]|uniref:OTU domain-containing protein n=3 Tax=Pseudozyma flocculosa TaxID=84751 RepID=A0A5C3FEI1_9BASI|nr:uncharacterized protein PSFLO_07560 [Pseudozyma flocculosa]